MIQRILLNIKLDKEKNAFLIQQKITDQIKKIIPEVVDQALKKNNIPDDITLFIPNLEIDLGKISEENYVNTFRQKLKIEFRKKLDIQIKHNLATQTSNSSGLISEKPAQTKHSYRIALEYLLKNGHFPWWFNYQMHDISTLFLKFSKEAPATFIKLLLGSNSTEKAIRIKRTANYIPDNIYSEFFFNLIKMPDSLKKSFQKTLSPDEEKQIYTQALTDLSAKKNKQAETAKFLLLELNKVSQAKKAQILDELLQKKDSNPLLQQILTKETIHEINKVSKKTTKQNKPTISLDLQNQVKSGEQELKKISKTQTKLSLDLFSFEFIQALLFQFFSTSQFFTWANELIKIEKSQKRIKTDIDFAQYLFNILKNKYLSEFKTNFIAYLNETSSAIFRVYPQKFTFEILLFLFSEKQEIFLKLNSLLKKQFAEEKVNIFCLENYDTIISNLNLENIEYWIDEFKKTQEVAIEQILVSISSLLKSGKIDNIFSKISTKELETMTQNTEISFWKENLSFNRYLFFIKLFPNNIIILVLQKLFAGKFEIIKNIWAELQLILNQSSPAFQQTQLELFFYKTAFEIYFENLETKELFLQKYYKAIITHFAENKDFETHFLHAISNISKNRIPLFHDFKADSFFFTTQTNLLENSIFTQTDRLAEQLFFYLKFGYLHWSSFTLNFKTFAQEIAQQFNQIKDFKPEEIKSFLQNPMAIKRLEAILGKDSLRFYISQITDQKQIEIPFSQEEASFEDLLNKKVDWVNQPVDDDKLYVKNAGLIVLANFFTFLFKRLKLIERKGKTHQFKDEKAQERAVILTQFLATGKEDFHEHELILNKIFCGWDIRKPINTQIKLTEKERSEAALLIQSAINHWNVLGSTSADGLRETFIRREGIISFKNSAYNMKVEQKAIDVLLSKLPWSFQTLKFSWNKYLILTEW